MSLIPLPGFLQGQLWKVATGLVGVVSIGLIAMLMASYFENRDLMHQRTVLMTSINDPKTGYIAQLSQAHTNVETLKVSLDTQRVALQAKADDANRELRVTEANLAAAQAKTKAMEVRLNKFLATGPQGATAADRIRDIDRRGLEEMVQ
jgi:hypothetical protein